ncbi:hypothetical protein ACROYT_G020790 [Oculina patagonica]
MTGKVGPKIPTSHDEAKVRLNLAVCPGAWLMPARMVINTESVVGYNNQLKQAVVGMKLGVNDEVNKATKKVGATSMSGGPSKVNRPTSHSSNPIHKAAKKEPAPHTPSAGTVTKTDEKQKPDTEDTAHEKNKIYLIAGRAKTPTNVRRETPNALKADRVRHRITFNPNKASPEEMRVAVPKLEEGVVLVPGSLALVFNLTASQRSNGVQLTHEQVKRLTDKEVEKYFKRMRIRGTKKGNLLTAR